MIVTLMTFKSYHDHTLPIFSDLKILNLHKLNDYLTCQFMFQYFSFRNLPQIFTDYFLTNKNTHNITQEIVTEQTIESGHLLIKELIYGTIFLCIRDKLGHVPYSKQQRRSISFI